MNLCETTGHPVVSPKWSLFNTCTKSSLCQNLALRDIISFAVVLGSNILAYAWNYYFIMQKILLAYNKIWIIWCTEHFLSDMKGKSSLKNFNMLRLGMCLQHCYVLTGLAVWVTGTLACDDLDAAACVRLASTRPNMCNDTCFASVCKRYCGKCRKYNATIYWT